MKKLFICILFFTQALLAQNFNTSLMQQINNEKNPIAAYDGAPYIFFTNKQNETPEKLSGFMDSVKKRRFGTTDILSLDKNPDLGVNLKPQEKTVESIKPKAFTVSTPFNQKIKTAWQNQTTDFLITMDIQNSSLLSITEEIQLIQNSLKMPTFQRIIPKTNASQKLTITNLFINNKKTIPQIKETQNYFYINTKEPLKQGLYSIKWHYVLENENLYESEIIKLYPLFNWPFAIDRFYLSISLPQEALVRDIQNLWGNNKKEIPNFVQTSIYKNKILYKFNHIIPAFASFETDLSLVLPEKSNALPFLFFIFMLILSGVLFFLFYRAILPKKVNLQNILKTPLWGLKAFLKGSGTQLVFGLFLIQNYILSTFMLLLGFQFLIIFYEIPIHYLFYVVVCFNIMFIVLILHKTLKEELYFIMKTTKYLEEVDLKTGLSETSYEKIQNTLEPYYQLLKIKRE